MWWISVISFSPLLSASQLNEQHLIKGQRFYHQLPDGIVFFVLPASASVGNWAVTWKLDSCECTKTWSAKHPVIPPTIQATRISGWVCRDNKYCLHIGVQSVAPGQYGGYTQRLIVIIWSSSHSPLFGETLVDLYLVVTDQFSCFCVEHLQRNTAH